MTTPQGPERNVAVSLPAELVEELGGPNADLAARVREATVLLLFQAGRISRGYAADLLGLGIWEFYDLLAKYDIPVTHGKEGEVEADVAAAEEFLRRRAR